ncbi:MAG TPA: ADP-ribosylglycohydrolase family protein [Galbitalea sp.]|jgi:ADP-ribosylglycohydrolase|nr:ADP-ribosylglycohydrolase family protein [Galbitalea sp.]
MSGRDSALGALYGLATGDALGMPTQMMSRSAIAQRYGTLNTFEPADDDHPLAAGMAAASITDDTEQALLVARLLVEGRGHVDGRRFAGELVRWENGMRARGSLDLLGPSTKRAVEAVLEGESVEESGRYGTTNGAAMRVAPVGIVVPSTDIRELVDRVEEASRVSHNTGVAIAGASAIAAVVSAGIDGATATEAVELAIEAARVGAGRGYWVAAADIGARIRLAIEVADPGDLGASLTRIYEVVGTSLASQESVAAAFGILSLYPGDPWAACLAAASLGGDSDTIAAMAGAMGGSLYGVDAFPAAGRRTVVEVNSLDLESVADQLLALR